MPVCWDGHIDDGAIIREAEALLALAPREDDHCHRPIKTGGGDGEFTIRILVCGTVRGWLYLAVDTLLLSSDPCQN